MKNPEEMSDAELLAWGGKRPRPRPWERSWWTWKRKLGLAIVFVAVLAAVVDFALRPPGVP